MKLDRHFKIGIAVGCILLISFAFGTDIISKDEALLATPAAALFALWVGARAKNK